MIKQQKMHVRVGDNVTIISGFHKNETGEVIRVNKNTGKIIVKGVNFKFKHIKPRTENEVGEIKQFEGICKGTIAMHKQGSDGFGYDPIFIAEGYSKSFAEIPAEEKNAISHRKKAFDRLSEYLEGL